MEPGGSGSDRASDSGPGPEVPVPGPGSRTSPTSASWLVWAVLYAVEVAVLALICLILGGLSAMLADTCFRDSPELICEPRWQTITALTPISALAVAVVVMAALVLRRRRLRVVVTAMVVTPVVPLAAFWVMQAIVTA